MTRSARALSRPITWIILFSFVTPAFGAEAIAPEYQEQGVFTKNLRQISDSIDVYLDYQHHLLTSSESLEAGEGAVKTNKKEELKNGLVEVVAGLSTPEFTEIQTKLARAFFYDPSHRAAIEDFLIALDSRLALTPLKKGLKRGGTLARDTLIVAAVVVAITLAHKYEVGTKAKAALGDSFAQIRGTEAGKAVEGFVQKPLVRDISVQKMAGGFWSLGGMFMSVFSKPSRFLVKVAEGTAKHPLLAGVVAVGGLEAARMWCQPEKGSSLLVLNAARGRVLMGLRDRLEAVKSFNKLGAALVDSPQVSTSSGPETGDLLGLDTLKLNSKEDVVKTLAQVDQELQGLEQSKLRDLDQPISEVRKVLSDLRAGIVL